MTHIVKHTTGHSEPFNEEKFRRSIYRTCLSAQTPSGEAKITAEWVLKELHTWLRTKNEITSADIRRHAAHRLAAYNPLAAYMYQSQANLRTYHKK